MFDAPTPTATRWKPLRLGLIDLFYYDDEVFPFVDGRLLLRGNNGTGKSKVLALTLPFMRRKHATPACVSIVALQSFAVKSKASDHRMVVSDVRLVPRGDGLAHTARDMKSQIEP